MKQLVCITGMPGSGKSIIAKAAADLKLPIINMGDVVREETLRRYGVITPDLMRKVSMDLRKELGNRIVAIRTLKKIKEINNPIVVVDGVRSLEEIEVFRKYGNVVIVAVHASPKTRFERIRRRGRPGDPDNWDDFWRRDLVELSFGIGNVIALADYMIVNEGSIEEAYKCAREILERLKQDVCKSKS